MMFEVGARCASPRNGAVVPLRGTVTDFPLDEGNKEKMQSKIDLKVLDTSIYFGELLGGDRLTMILLLRLKNY